MSGRYVDGQIFSWWMSNAYLTVHILALKTDMIYFEIIFYSNLSIVDWSCGAHWQFNLPNVFSYKFGINLYLLTLDYWHLHTACSMCNAKVQCACTFDKRNISWKVWWYNCLVIRESLHLPAKNIEKDIQWN